ncbi:hypothetical protein PPL_07792 [Heterostelium album PN500]|uniref:Uncharacterized protein n=1 Tax=Heterostelium pallidum (strain ATCC 26659 / Pp 5 / PN500) TaxID=670386 RepID=D3BGZ0_HETP5|nr:hypothetical protein PPL_07792 [Heterostelium album PN500]EFA79374.1 hypothetical protein PPL_07792 [Heterostelium album PN500]|eukprot:XP_020431495.1 hypothetical protein PPL_07792 [Heterostelium album PN500]
MENNEEEIILPAYQVVLSKIDTVMQTLDCKTSDPEFKRPTRGNIVKSAKTLSHEITKISLLLQDCRAKPEFFSNIEECLDNLFSIYQGLCGYSGASLFRQIQIYFKRVYKSLYDTLYTFMENEKRIGEDEENTVPKERIGIAWKSCELLEKIPLRNSSAICVRMEELLTMINDAYDEVDEVNDGIENYKKRMSEPANPDDEEAEEKSTEKGGKEDKKTNKQVEKDDEDEEDEDEDDEDEDELEFVDDGEDDEEEDDDFFIEDQAFTGSSSMRMLNDEEMNAIATIWELAEKCVEYVDEFETYVKDREPTKPEDLDDLSSDLKPEQLAVYEDLVLQFDELSKTVDDVVSGIYPPQNAYFISGQIEYLQSKLNKMAKTFKDNNIEFRNYAHQEVIDKLLTATKIEK